MPDENLRIKIWSNGDPAFGKNIRITDQDGRIIEGVKSIKWEATAGNFPILTIEFEGASIDCEVTDPHIQTKPKAKAG